MWNNNDIDNHFLKNDTREMKSRCENCLTTMKFFLTARSLVFRKGVSIFAGIFDFLLSKQSSNDLRNNSNHICDLPLSLAQHSPSTSLCICASPSVRSHPLFILLKFSTRHSVLDLTPGHSSRNSPVSRAQFPLVAISCLPFSESIVIVSNGANSGSKYCYHWGNCGNRMKGQDNLFVQLENLGKTDRFRVNQVKWSRITLLHQ